MQSQFLLHANILPIFHILECYFKEAIMRKPKERVYFYPTTISDAVFQIVNFDTPVRIGMPEFYTCDFHVHPHYEIHCVLEGEKQMKLIDLTTKKIEYQTIKANQLMLVPNHIFHATASLKSRFCYNIAFKMEQSQENASCFDSSFYEKLAAVTGALKQPIIIESDELTAIFNKVRKAYSENENGEYLPNNHAHQLLNIRVLSIAMETLLQNTSTDYKAPQTIGDREREYIIWDFIYRNRTLPELADYLHLSCRQTQNEISRITGGNFKKLILDQRMTLANLLIDNSNLPLSEIANYVGYTSYGSFYTVYREYHGFGPQKKREHIRECAAQ